MTWRARSSCLLLAALAAGAVTSPTTEPTMMTLGPAWAANSVNAVVFRGDPITTHGDQQFAAYYDADGRIVVARRTIGEPRWTPATTALRADVRDAHNSISLIADGAGVLHLSWGHHGVPLLYARGTEPGATTFDARATMVGTLESHVTYPQFFRLPGGAGDLLFFYRDGGSGNGNLVVNRYDVAAGRWSRLHDNLISGEGSRNAYWQAEVDRRGTVHVSWCWRESPDVASNHDVCYAASDDGGQTWRRSDGRAYALPITAATAEVACAVPQRRELINQTSMCADDAGRPMVATYFRPDGSDVPQYALIWHDGAAWRTSIVSKRTTPFTLSGTGSKRIPISRPQVVCATRDGKTSAWMIFRDSAERGGRPSVAHCADLAGGEWATRDLADVDLGFWEPSFDRVRWSRDAVLDLFVQHVGQGDGETLDALGPQDASALEWVP